MKKLMIILVVVGSGIILYASLNLILPVIKTTIKETEYPELKQFKRFQFYVYNKNYYPFMLTYLSNGNREYLFSPNPKPNVNSYTCPKITINSNRLNYWFYQPLFHTNPNINEVTLATSVWMREDYVFRYLRSNRGYIFVD